MRLRSILLVLAVTTVPFAFPTGAGAFQYLSQFGTGASGTAAGQLTNPEGVDIGPNGHVYIGEYDGRRVDEFTSTGTFVRMWGWGVQDGGSSFQICQSGCEAGLSGSGDGQFKTIGDLEVNPVTGDVYTMEDTDSRIQQFDSSGSFIRKWGSAGSAAGQMSGPYGFGVDANAIYVADVNNNRVQQFTPAGTFVRVWGWGVQNGAAALQVCTSGCQGGISGTGDGELPGPIDATVAAAGDVYVSDNSNRIQQFTGTGSFVRKFGQAGSGPGDLSSSVTGLATDAGGNLWVMDADNSRLEQFTAAGSFLFQFGSGGSGPGQFNNPYSINFDCRGNLYAADLGNHRVQKFGEPGAGEPPCAASGGGSNPPAGPGADKAAPKQVVKAGKKQKLTSLAISVTLSEAGTVTLDGSVNVPKISKLLKFKQQSKNAGVNQTVKLKPKLSKRNAAKVKKALRKRKKLTAKFKLKAIDTAGNPSTVAVSVKLKR